MKQVLRCSVCAAVCLLLTQLSIASDGAIPIWEPTTITESGSYIVTRNISSSLSSTMITIAADYVTLDLGGHTLTQLGLPRVIRADDVTNITIRNGIMDAGDRAIEINNSEAVVIEDLKMDCGYRAITMTDASGFRISDNQITGHATVSAMSITGNNGVIEDNTVVGFFEDSIRVTGNNIRVLRNTVWSKDIATWAITVTGDRCVIAENHSNMWGFRCEVNNSRIIGNIIDGNASDNGMEVDGDHNVVANNVISSWRHDLIITGARNLIEKNTFDTTRCGIYFSATSSDNIYSGNTGWGTNCATYCTGTTTPAFCDEGTNNTTHGDNYLPYLM